MKILLMGHPNAGKSVLFNRLTGASVIESNYPGTTIDYTKGYMRVGGEEGWFNTLEGFFGTYAPPYAPAIFLLPFSLVVFYYILKKERNILKKEKAEE